MQIELWLKDRVRWLLNPSTTVNLLASGLATFYAWVTLELSPSDRTLLGTLVALGVTAAIVTAEIRMMQRLRNLRGLASGALPPTPQTLVQAIAEVHGFPDYLAVLTALCWVCAITGVALGLWYFGDATAGTALRLGTMGVLFGAMTAGVVNLLVMRRARVLIEAMATGVSSQEVIAALPATKLQVRARLVAMTVALVILPSVMLVDASRQQTQRHPPARRPGRKHARSGAGPA